MSIFDKPKDDEDYLYEELQLLRQEVSSLKTKLSKSYSLKQLEKLLTKFYNKKVDVMYPDYSADFFIKWLKGEVLDDLSKDV